MKKLFCSFYFVLLTLSAYNQNLILNGDFETINQQDPPIPCEYIYKGEEFSRKTAVWGNHPNDTPDILFTPAEQAMCLPVKAHSGTYMAALITYHPFMDSGYTTDYHEFIEGQFTNDLEKGKRYIFSFWIYTDDSIGYHHLNKVLGQQRIKIFPTQIDSIGILLSKTSVGAAFSHTKIIGNQTLKSQITAKIPFHKNKKWQQIEVAFVADDTYRFFTIGNFKADSLTKTTLPLLLSKRIDSLNQGQVTLKNKKLSFWGRSKRIAYYCLDDFSCEQSDKAIIALTPDQPYTFRQLLFETNKVDILPTSYNELNSLVQYLKNNRFQYIEIQGHTDNVGNDNHNMLLSQQRADNVAKYLVAHGLNQQQIKTKGYGATKPIVTNTDDEKRSKNRRVEVHIIL